MSKSDGGDREAPPRVLIADDEPALVRAFARILRAAGFEVESASNGREAAARVAEGGFHAVLSDICMPDMDGIAFLREVRRRDQDLPVILMTGTPAVETAVEALDGGALKYLVKPVTGGELVRAVERAVAISRAGEAARRAAPELRALEASFNRALDQIWMAFQPIVRVSDRTLFGYEALVRSAEPALPHPGALLTAAERVGRLQDLGRAIRARVAEAAVALPAGLIFVNLHTRDLADELLFAADAPLSALAGRVVLEMTERASLDEIKDARPRVARLRESGFRIAIDDLGAGFAGLTSFVQLEPEVVKLDMSLVRNVDQEPMKARLVRSMAVLCREQGIEMVCEGIETAAERDTLVSLGCDLLQGYLFAKPARGFPPVTW
jgi:EAL domain-containing protein (putative c-di-GMP-specific phosphodiesterase class I)/CheY-like chemotaxis protein